MKTKEEKKQHILDTFAEIEEKNKSACWNLFYQITLQVSGFVEKFKYRESVKDELDSTK